ncbi:MAG: hypothetical protein K2W78_06230 [Xanthobacteraceae bacterium]|nr:hypothetical protein [Xanthobacteraceae bacterium]
MPADLHLRSTFKTLKPDEPERDRFIDTYDKYGLFRLIGLSWQRDVLPVLDRRDCLPVDEARRLRERLEGIEITGAMVENWRIGTGLNRPRDEWLDHFRGQRKGLIDLLWKSIELNEPLQCHL